MEIVIGLIALVIVGVVLYFAVKNKGALELFSDAPYKTEAPKIGIKEDDIIVYPQLKAVTPTNPIISPEKGKMGKPKLVKVEGGPSKSKTKSVPEKAKPKVAQGKPQGKPQGTKNKTTAPKSKTTATSPPTNKKRKPKI
jgi:hypothetical protein